MRIVCLTVLLYITLLVVLGKCTSTKISNTRRYEKSVRVLDRDITSSILQNNIVVTYHHEWYGLLKVFLLLISNKEKLPIMTEELSHSSSYNSQAYNLHGEKMECYKTSWCWTFTKNGTYWVCCWYQHEIFWNM